MTLDGIILEICIPILASILGIAFPIIIQTIGRIDEKYNSIRLVNRFQKETEYKLFVITLGISIAFLFYHFLLAKYFVWRYDWGFLNFLMSNSSSIILIILTMILIMSLFILIFKIITYYNYQSLFNLLYKSVRSQKISEEKANDFIALASYIFTKDDNDTSRKVYEFLRDYSIQNYHNNNSFEKWFYDAILILNETLCKQESKLISIHNGNDILNLLLPSFEIKSVEIKKETYRVLWIALQQQVFYDKEEWFYEYWGVASQFRQMNLNQIQTEIGFSESGEIIDINEELEDFQAQQSNHFEEFYIQLGGLLLRKRKYNLLKRVLSFTQTYPYQYPLIPSSLDEICEIFERINTQDFNYPFYYTGYYFLGEKGIKRGQNTLIWMNKYLSLLLFRLNSNEVKFMASWIDPWKYPQLPSSLKDLVHWRKRMEQLIHFVQQLEEEQDILKEFRFLQGQKQPFSEIQNIIQEIERCISVKKPKLSLNRKQEFYDETKIKIKNSIEVLSNFVRFGNSEDDVTSYLLNGYVSMLFPNEAFSTDSTVSYTDSTSVLVKQSVFSVYQYFCRNFLIVKKKTYSISSNDLFIALNKMIGGKFQDYVIIAFNVFLDKYLKGQNKVEGLEKDEDDIINKYSYNKKLTILSFPKIGDTFVNQTIAIIKRTGLPYLECIEPQTDIKNKFFKDSENILIPENSIYTSLIKLSENKEIKQEVIDNKMKYNITQHMERLEDYCLASVFYQVKLSWEDNANVIMLRLLDPYLDNGIGEEVKNLPVLD